MSTRTENVYLRVVVAEVLVNVHDEVGDGVIRVPHMLSAVAEPLGTKVSADV